MEQRQDDKSSINVTTNPALLLPPGPSGSVLPSQFASYSRSIRRHPENGAVFCGLRLSLRDIIQSKSSSYLCNVGPMMYSQNDLFYSPRARRNEDGDLPHDPKAHLHYNSAVRQSVEQYSDVLTSLRCRYMNNIVTEVMHLCPLLENTPIVRSKVIASIKSYISNAVAHYKRKKRKLAQTQDVPTTESIQGGTEDGETVPLSDTDEFQDSPGSYQDDLIDYSNLDDSVPLNVKSPARDDGIIIVQSHPDAVSTPTVSSKPHPSSSQPARQTYVKRDSLTPVVRAPNFELSNIRSVAMETSCVASSVERENEFRFSDGPTMEDLRAVQAEFAKERDWDQFHQPRNLLLAMVGEVGEVSELFQWRGECREGLSDWSEKDKKHLGQELSDVLMYLIRLAEKCHVDLPQAALEKIGLNASKYPAHKVHGSSKKYTEYD